MKREILVSVGIAAALGLTACQKKQEPPPAPPKAEMPAAPAPGAMPPPGMGGMPGGMPGAAPGGMPAAPAAPRAVVVPEEVSKSWKAVVLQVTDKKTNKTQDVKVDIGQTAKVGDLEVTVESFLPSFTMGGGNITSKNNNTENPAAKVIVKEKGAEIFAGWLFSLYPQAHPMQHEKYSLALKDFVKK